MPPVKKGRSKSKTSTTPLRPSRSRRAPARFTLDTTEDTTSEIATQQVQPTPPRQPDSATDALVGKVDQLQATVASLASVVDTLLSRETAIQTAAPAPSTSTVAMPQLPPPEPPLPTPILNSSHLDLAHPPTTPLPSHIATYGESTLMPISAALAQPQRPILLSSGVAAGQHLPDRIVCLSQKCM